MQLDFELHDAQSASTHQRMLVRCQHKLGVQVWPAAAAAHCGTGVTAMALMARTEDGGASQPPQPNTAADTASPSSPTSMAVVVDTSSSSDGSDADADPEWKDLHVFKRKVCAIS